MNNLAVTEKFFLAALGVACVNTNRNFIGFELEQKFYDIALKRIDEAIAKQAQRLF